MSPSSSSSKRPAFSATESGLTWSRTAFLNKKEGDEGGEGMTVTGRSPASTLTSEEETLFLMLLSLLLHFLSFGEGGKKKLGVL